MRLLTNIAGTGTLQQPLTAFSYTEGRTNCAFPQPSTGTKRISEKNATRVVGMEDNSCLLTSPLGENNSPHFAVREGRLSLERLLDEAGHKGNSIEVVNLGQHKPNLAKGTKLGDSRMRSRLCSVVWHNLIAPAISAAASAKQLDEFRSLPLQTPLSGALADFKQQEVIMQGRTQASFFLAYQRASFMPRLLFRRVGAGPTSWQNFRSNWCPGWSSRCRKCLLSQLRPNLQMTNFTKIKMKQNIRWAAKGNN